MRLALPVLAVAIGMTLINPAAADLRLSTSGLGDAVYVPFYSVDNGLDSLISIGNDSDQPTMVRLLLAEALNGQTVTYFNVYLPPHAVWSAAVSATDDGGARLTSSSNVCTVPNLTSAGFPLLNFDYASNFPDGGPSGISRTRNGAMEVLELATLTGDLADLTRNRDCAALQSSYTIVSGMQPDHSDMILPPDGKVSANLQLVSVADGLIFRVPGIPLLGTSDTARDPDFDSAPRFANPVLPQGETSFVTATASGRLRFAGGRGPDAISSLFMHGQLGGEFYGDPGLGASTRWAVSFPTKAAYVSDRPGSLASDGQATSPFSTFFGADGACDTVSTRDGFLDGTPLVTVAPTTIDLCAQVNVISFENAFTDTGKRDLRLVEPQGRSIAAESLDGTPLVLTGMPAVGVQMSNFVNGQLQGGVLANYSISQPLRSTPSAAEIPLAAGN